MLLLSWQLYMCLNQQPEVALTHGTSCHMRKTSCKYFLHLVHIKLLQTCSLGKNQSLSALQISTAIQTAVAMVAFYPFTLNHIITEDLAASRGEPSLSDILSQTAVPLQVLTWNHVRTYAHSINVNNMMTGVPFIDSVSKLCA